MKRILSVLIMLCAAAAIVASQERFVKPVDEAAKDPSFLAFRTKLIAAAEKKDAAYIISILDPKVTASYGGHEGISGFKEYWKLNTKNTRFWDEFLMVMRNGGRFNTQDGVKGFSAPYVFTDMPDDLDMFEYHAIFGSSVNVREQPNPNAKVITRLSYNIVKIDEAAAIRKKYGPGEGDWTYDWHKVESLGGIKGWVKAEYVRSSIDYRAGFEKKKGKWKMTYLVAGD